MSINFARRIRLIVSYLAPIDCQQLHASMIYTPATQLEPDLWLLDLAFQEAPGVVAAFLITGRDGHTLIETGPGSTLPALERAVAATGVQFEDITQILVTHIHLDHAGAAGSLLRRLPHATLFVHPVGAPHMVDPAKLLRSATRIYGDRMDALWGAFEPCPADRVSLLADGAEIVCGERTIQALHTPGHASHHIAFHDAERHSAFTGDVGGVRLQGASYVRPPTPPPDIDIQAWHASIERLRGLQLTALDLTHFGRFDGPSRHLDELLVRLDEWAGWVKDWIAAGLSPDEMAAQLQRRSDADIAANVPDLMLAQAYELATPSRMTVDGLSRYLLSS
jgi:glyoxylase-like metal-dependent hydrolase (beta-lactamase superfamily II)